MKIGFPHINNNIAFGVQKSTLNCNNYVKNEELNDLKPANICENTIKKPLSVLRQETAFERQQMLEPIKTQEEYNVLLNEILSYRAHPSPNGLRAPIISRWDYENSDNCLKGLIAYCGGEDKSDMINCWLTGRTFHNHNDLTDEQISKIIRCMDYSLKQLDDIYGTYKGIVYRKGFFNPVTDKQFYSTSSEAIKAVNHSKENVPSEENPYSIIKVKNGHDIQAFQLNANSFLSRKFAQTEKEILIDRLARFRLVPESEYTEADKRLKAVLLTQALKSTDDITQKDIDYTLNNKGALLKYISIWEEI
jgi:hypothetical protein